MILHVRLQDQKWGQMGVPLAPNMKMKRKDVNWMVAALKPGL